MIIFGSPALVPRCIAGRVKLAGEITQAGSAYPYLTQRCVLPRRTVVGKHYGAGASIARLKVYPGLRDVANVKEKRWWRHFRTRAGILAHSVLSPLSASSGQAGTADQQR